MSGGGQHLTEEASRKLYSNALEAALKEAAAAAAAVKPPPSEPASTIPAGAAPDANKGYEATAAAAAAGAAAFESQKRSEARVMLHAGGRVEPSLLTAFR